MIRACFGTGTGRICAFPTVGNHTTMSSETFRVGDLWESPMQHRFEVSSVEDGIATLEPRSVGAYWHRWPADCVGRWQLQERAERPTHVDHQVDQGGAGTRMLAIRGLTIRMRAGHHYQFLAGLLRRSDA